jgi:hypothetical protein
MGLLLFPLPAVVGGLHMTARRSGSVTMKARFALAAVALTCGASCGQDSTSGLQGQSLKEVPLSTDSRAKGDRFEAPPVQAVVGGHETLVLLLSKDEASQSILWKWHALYPGNEWFPRAEESTFQRFFQAHFLPDPENVKPKTIRSLWKEEDVVSNWGSIPAEKILPGRKVKSAAPPAADVAQLQDLRLTSLEQISVKMKKGKDVDVLVDLTYLKKEDTSEKTNKKDKIENNEDPKVDTNGNNEKRDTKKDVPKVSKNDEANSIQKNSELSLSVPQGSYALLEDPRFAALLSLAPEALPQGELWPVQWKEEVTLFNKVPNSANSPSSSQLPRTPTLVPLYFFVKEGLWHGLLRAATALRCTPFRLDFKTAQAPLTWEYQVLFVKKGGGESLVRHSPGKDCLPPDALVYVRGTPP